MRVSLHAGTNYFSAGCDSSGQNLWTLMTAVYEVTGTCSQIRPRSSWVITPGHTHLCAVGESGGDDDSNQQGGDCWREARDTGHDRGERLVHPRT